MVRAISAALLTAQSAMAQPAIFLRVNDCPPLAERIDPLGYALPCPQRRQIALAGPVADGYTFVRCYVSGDGALYAARDRLDGSSVTWQQVATGVKTTGQPIAACLNVDDKNHILLAFVAADNRSIYTVTSTDAGQSWSAPALVYTAPSGTINALARTRTAVVSLIYFARDPGGTDPDDELAVLRWTAASGWTGPYVQPTARWSALNGIAADLDVADPSNPWLLLTSGAGASLPAAVDVCKWFDATLSWDIAHHVMLAPAGSGYTFKWPTMIVKGRYGFPLTLYAWLEQYNGSPAYNRYVTAWTPRYPSIPPPLPFPFASYGDWPLALGRGNVDNFLVGADLAYKWPQWSGSPTQKSADLGPYVRAFTLYEEEDEPGRLEIELDDEGGRFAGAGIPGAPFAMLRPGSQILLGIGRQTTAGPQFAYQAHWWVTHTEREAVRHHPRREQGTTRFILHATNARGWIREIHASFSFSRNTYAQSEILNWLLSLCAGTIVLPHDSRLNRTLARVLIDVGESFDGHLQTLLEENGYLIRWQTAQTDDFTGPSLITAQLKSYNHLDEALSAPELGDPSGIPLLACRHYQLPPGPNHVEVYGAIDPVSRRPYFGEAWNSTAINSLQQHRVKRHTDLNLASDADALDVAQRLLLRAKQHQRQTEVIVPYDARIELGDMVAITDAAIGLAHARHYVRGLRGRYDADRAIYDLAIIADHYEAV